jgi:type IV secretion system protein TrbL
MKNFPTVVAYMVAYWLIILAFVLVALHMMITIIEFYFAIMCAAVLFPWGLLTHTAFLCEFVVSWITAGLIRVLLTVGIMSISLPLFEQLAFTTTPGGDPTMYGALIYACAAGIFSILAWQLPTRAAAIAGRGMALGLTGGILLPHSGVRAIAAGGRGLLNMGRHALGEDSRSRMIQARRG